MGIGPGYRSRSHTSSAPNPNPSRFEILGEVLVSGNVLILKVKYPDATNYEGVKIMVYKGYTSSKELLSKTRNLLDPHFSKTVSPIARFLPTDEGMGMALKFAMSLGNP